MKELLQRYKAESRWEIYCILRRAYFFGFDTTSKSIFEQMEAKHKEEFINSMSPYDPAYAFFSTLEFTETV